MPVPVSTQDPRRADYKWKRLITKHWRDVNPLRLRRCEHLATKLHNALGAKWELTREDGSYTVAGRDKPEALVKLSLWKEMEMLVAFRSDTRGAYAAAAELSPKVLGLWVDGPENRYFCAVVPDEGQETEILLAVHDFLQPAANPV